jgi:hypothetical protein
MSKKATCHDLDNQGSYCRTSHVRKRPKNKNEDHLLFQNKYDGTLWSLHLTE